MDREIANKMEIRKAVIPLFKSIVQEIKDSSTEAIKSIENAIHKSKITFPEVFKSESVVTNFPKVQEVVGKVEVTNQKDPIINIPAPIVNVEKTEVVFPEVQRVDGNIESASLEKRLDSIEKKINQIKPFELPKEIPVRVTNQVIGDGGSSKTWDFKDGNGRPTQAIVNTQGNVEVSLEELNSNISANNGKQLKVTNYNSSGQEGVNLIDPYGFTAEFTPMDEIRSVTPVRLVGASFQNGGNAGAVDSNFWVATPTNGGAAVQAAGQVTLSTNTTANAAISLRSNRRARYLGGSSNRFRASIRLGDTGTANNTRRWGIFDGTDGAYFKISGTTVSVCTIKAGSEVPVASSLWNGSTTVPTLTDCQTYEIYITNKNVYFVISGVLVHTATFNTTTWTETTDLPILIDNTNSGGSITNVTIEVRVATIYRLGNLSTQPMYRYQSGTTAGIVCKYGAGNLHGIAISAVSQNSVITLYDNTAASGTVLWSSGAMGSQTQPFDIELHDIPFSIGLTLVIAAASSTVTLAYE